MVPLEWRLFYPFLICAQRRAERPFVAALQANFRLVSNSAFNQRVLLTRVRHIAQRGSQFNAALHCLDTVSVSVVGVADALHFRPE